MDNKLIVGVISVLVIVTLLGSVLVPVIDGLAGGVEYEDNPDWDGWVRFDLNTSADATYHLGMSQDDNGIYVENIFSESRDMQIYDDSATVDYPTIMYADSNTVVWSDDDTFNVMGKINGSPVFVNAPILDIIRDANGVEVVTDTDSYLFDAPTWAYVPLSQGKYGFYPYNEERGVEHPANAPTAVLGGGFAGVYAYNDIYRYNGLGLNMHPVYDEGGLFYGAYWDKTAAAVDPQSLNPDMFDPAVIDFDPSIIDLDPLDPGAQIMAVPTPTYTDGDWGYDKMTVDGVTYAKIVSYSGAGGGTITIPSSVGGYAVYQVGLGNQYSDKEVFDASITATDLIISDGPVVIGAYAFYLCNGLTGDLVIPSSVTTIEKDAFYQCSGFTGSLVIPSSVTTIGNEAFYLSSGFTGDLVIPSSVTTLGYNAFRECTSLTGSLVIPSSVTTLGASAFYGCTNISSVIISSDATPGNSDLFKNSTSITEVLDLSDTVDYSANRYGLPAAATVSDSIGDCFGFVSIVTTEHGSSGALGGAAALLYAIPVVIIAAMLVAGVGWFIGKRY